MLGGANAYPDRAGGGGWPHAQVHQSKYSARDLSITLTVLAAPVAYVLKLRTKDKVVGVHARGRIAVVHDYIVRAYRTFKEAVRDAVREYLLCGSARSDLAVPVIVLAPKPEPAFVGLAAYEFFLETVDKWSHTPIMGKTTMRVNPPLAGG
jgi:hypothetical protein